MATPTPHSTLASKQTPAAAHNVATPAAFSSPAPRSVPSPAVHRTMQAGKSPFPSAQNVANHPTGSSAGDGSGGKGRSGVLGSSPALNFDSPSTTLAAMGFGGLGGDLGVGMAASMSQMGIGMGASLSGLGLARAHNDEEFYRRLREMRGLFKDDLGRIGLEGLQRCAAKLGLDSVVENKNLGGGRTGLNLSLAGRTDLLVDIGLEDDLVKSVEIAAPEIWKDAKEILLKGLTAKDPYALANKRLYNGFAPNLELLTNLDRLSTADLNCFEALSGLHASLEVLHNYELSVVDIPQKRPQDRALASSREVLCKRSGRPRLHADDRVGLTLDYWMDGRKSITPDTTTPTYTLQIECESDPTALYTPIRVSKSWIGDLPSSDPKPSDFTIPWQDPTLTFSSETSSLPPAVRFVAKLSPPLVVPPKVAHDIHAAVNSTFPSQYHLATPYEELLTMPTHEISRDENAWGKPLRSSRIVHSHFSGPEERGLRRHTATLMKSKIEPGVHLESIPFAHPKELVALLPILRQHAYTNSLLKRSFTSSVKLGDPRTLKEAKLPPLEWKITRDHLLPGPRFSVVVTPQVEDAGEDEDFLQGLANGAGSTTTDGTNRHGADVPHVTFDVLADGEIKVIHQNLVAEGDEGAVKRIEKALQVLDNLGTWVEWLCGEWKKKHTQ